MMGRVKTPMELITSDKKRKSVFETRSNCIKKKAYELSTLCAVNVCLIITDPTTLSSDTNIKTHTWPNNKGDRMMLLDDMITRYKNQDLVQRKKRKTNGELFFGNDETRQYPTSKLDSKYEGMSEQELRKLATFLDSKVEKVKERIQYLKKGKHESSTSTNQPYLVDLDDENKGRNLCLKNQPELVNIDSDDGAHLTYLLGQILGNPMTPTTDDLPLHDSGIDFGIPWSDDLPLLVDPTTNSSSTDTSNLISMQSGHQLNMTTPDFQPVITQYPNELESFGYYLNKPPPITQYPNELESFSYYLNKPPPQYFDLPIFCQPLEPHINTSSISHLNSNSSVWSMPLLS